MIIESEFTPVIGVIGLKGVGKSVVAERLRAKWGFETFKFGAVLKQMLRTLGLDDDHIEGQLKEEPCDLLGGKSPRLAMQTLGTEWGRRLIHPDIWVNAWRHRVWDGEKLRHGPVCADDVRFQNEADVIHGLSGVVWRIKRPGLTADDTHVSEAGQTAITADLTIVNHGTVEDLRKQVDQCVRLCAADATEC